MTSSDEIMTKADEVLRRHSDQRRGLSARGRERRNAAILAKLKRIAWADFAILMAAIVTGFFVPLGGTGVMIALGLMILATLLFSIFPLTPEAKPEQLAAVDIKLLPLQTEQWLERQRPALPAPAVQLVDSIGVRLEALAPQLQTLDPREPAAAEVRRLVAEELPALVSGYQRVPHGLRANGPDRQLVEGLGVVESELARMTQQLAEGDLDKLATQGKYLELKYRGDEGV